MGATVTRATAALIALLALTTAAAAASGKDTTVWLCKPGLADDPCTPGLDTTEVSPTGLVLGVEHVEADPSPGADCFYVYPTVSDDQTANSDLSIDPEERSTPVDGAPLLRAIPDATWGLYLVDANIALGNLVSVVRSQIAHMTP